MNWDTVPVLIGQQRIADMTLPRRDDMTTEDVAFLRARILWEFDAYYADGKPARPNPEA
jgi:hypothetical protein